MRQKTNMGSRPRFLRILDHFPRRADVSPSFCFLLCLWKHVSTFSSQPTLRSGKRKAPLACLQKSMFLEINGHSAPQAPRPPDGGSGDQSVPQTCPAMRQFRFRRSNRPAEMCSVSTALTRCAGSEFLENRRRRREK